jgi:hypothetical protein
MPIIAESNPIVSREYLQMMGNHSLFFENEEIKMKLSVTVAPSGSKFAPMVFQGDFVTQIQNAAQSGFKAVELQIRDPKALDWPIIIRTLEQ